MSVVGAGLRRARVLLVVESRPAQARHAHRATHLDPAVVGLLPVLAAVGVRSRRRDTSSRTSLTLTSSSSRARNMAECHPAGFRGYWRPSGVARRSSTSIRGSRRPGARLRDPHTCLDRRDRGRLGGADAGAARLVPAPAGAGRHGGRPRGAQLTAAGAALSAVGRGRRGVRAVAAGALLAGALCQPWACTGGVHLGARPEVHGGAAARRSAPRRRGDRHLRTHATRDGVPGTVSTGCASNT